MTLKEFTISLGVRIGEVISSCDKLFGLIAKGGDFLFYSTKKKTCKFIKDKKTNFKKKDSQ